MQPTIELTRTVRFCINGAPSPTVADHHAATGAGSEGAPEVVWPPRHNAYSAWPAMRGLGRYYEVDVCCAGPADPVTGYFISIRHIDRAVSQAVIPHLEALISSTPTTTDVPMGVLMQTLINLVQKPLNDTVVELRLDLTPYYSLAIRSGDMGHIIIRQEYEFAAAHRLHADRLSDDENRAVFGKCNNPSGHGHNYRVQVAVCAPINDKGRVIPVEALDALVDEVILQELDHKHLNIDVPQFSALNPSVENIAVVIYGMLERRIGDLGVVLDEVSIWETEKTVCTYRGNAPAANIPQR